MLEFPHLDVFLSLLKIVFILEMPNYAEFYLIPDFQYQLVYPVWTKSVKKTPKIESENKFLTSIKGYNSVLICQNLPICNPRTLLHNIDSHTQFEENR